LHKTSAFPQIIKLYLLSNVKKKLANFADPVSTFRTFLDSLPLWKKFNL